ncbi:hypothetical protein CRG98_011314 [Punica granatum]|uniref:Uncharacterized protein n=1 Tax=Punica granatum TaxID=22663 RepID=A0A2I0KID8_PUNGR|nr:hypothetical protein CRG98_011314 [Punica granatum]
MKLEDFTISFTRRKWKNEISMEEFLNFSASYSKILNKMARTIGHQAHMDWTTMHIGPWHPGDQTFGVHSPIEAQNYDEKMDEEANAEDIHMAEEASLIKPPRQP